MPTGSAATLKLCVGKAAQCGFGGTVHVDNIAAGGQRRKLAPGVETARDVRGG